MKTFCLPTLVLALPLLFASHSQAAVFIKFDGVDGESVDELHRGAIDVQSFSWGMSNSGAPAGGGAGKASFQDINFTRYIDKSSPLLAKACASGKHIAKAEIFVRKSGGSGDYYVITLTDVLVSSIDFQGDSSGSRPVESISFNFTKIEWRYVPTAPDGTTEPAVEAGWDVVANTPYP